MVVDGKVKNEAFLSTFSTDFLEKSNKNAYPKLCKCTTEKTDFVIILTNIRRSYAIFPLSASIVPSPGAVRYLICVKSRWKNNRPAAGKTPCRAAETELFT